jgi:NCS1 family nucleobase:cation symporter-1
MAGAQITMAVNISDITRSLRADRGSTWARRNRGSAIAQFFGLVPPMAMFVIVGMTSGLATGEWNPILVMADVFGGNTLLLVLVLGSFVIFAQVASNTGQNLLPPGYVFVNLFPRKITFPVAVIAAGVVGLVITPWNFAEYIPTILLIISALLGPIVGIMVSDYYLIRRTNVNVRDLYEAGGQYRYWNNFNPAALIVYFVSAAVGILVPDFSFFVALVVSFFAYYALMKFWILRRYPQSEVEDEETAPTTDRVSV